MHRQREGHGRLPTTVGASIGDRPSVTHAGPRSRTPLLRFCRALPRRIAGRSKGPRRYFPRNGGSGFLHERFDSRPELSKGSSLGFLQGLRCGFDAKCRQGRVDLPSSEALGSSERSRTVPDSSMPAAAASSSFIQTKDWSRHRLRATAAPGTSLPFPQLAIAGREGRLVNPPAPRSPASAGRAAKAPTTVGPSPHTAPWNSKAERSRQIPWRRSGGHPLAETWAAELPERSSVQPCSRGRLDRRFDLAGACRDRLVR